MKAEGRLRPRSGAVGRRVFPPSAPRLSVSWKSRERRGGPGGKLPASSGMQENRDPSALERTPADRCPRRGWKHPLFFGTALLILASDLGTKAMAFEFLEEHGIRGLGGLEYRVWPGVFHLARVENYGTIWGLFQDGTLPLTILRILMVAALMGFAWKSPPSAKLRLTALGFVLGGALGNLYDNLFWNGGAFQGGGAVRDFLDFYIPLPWRDQAYHYPTFNLADSSILVGAVLLFLAFSREERRDRHRKKSEVLGGGGR